MKTLINSTIILLLVLGWAQVGHSQSQERAASSNEVTEVTSDVGQPLKADVSQSTPELALKKFMLMMLSGDIEKLKAVTHPHDEIEVLLPKAKLPAAALEQMKGAFQSIPITRLKVGDSFKLPSGEMTILDDSKINEKNAMLNFAGNPFPIAATLNEGVWKINPKPMIATRKAAARVMKARAKAAAAQPGSQAK